MMGANKQKLAENKHVLIYLLAESFIIYRLLCLTP